MLKLKIKLKVYKEIKKECKNEMRKLQGKRNVTKINHPQHAELAWLFY